jgi:hypothetical protein
MTAALPDAGTTDNLPRTVSHNKNYEDFPVYLVPAMK